MTSVASATVPSSARGVSTRMSAVSPGARAGIVWLHLSLCSSLSASSLNAASQLSPYASSSNAFPSPRLVTAMEPTVYGWVASCLASCVERLFSWVSSTITGRGLSAYRMAKVEPTDIAVAIGTTRTRSRIQSLLMFTFRSAVDRRRPPG